MNTHKLQRNVFCLFMHLFTQKDCDTSDNCHQKFILHNFCCKISNHMLSIMIKLSTLIHLYFIYICIFLYNSLTIKQVMPVTSTKSFIWNHEIHDNISDNWKEDFTDIYKYEEGRQVMSSVWFIFQNQRVLCCLFVSCLFYKGLC